MSVDQIVSAQPGLIPQISVFLTNQRLWGAITFVDHSSYYVYVHLMQDLSLAETLLVKEATEKEMAQVVRSSKHYHANNGTFSSNGFVDSINSKSQKLTFCEVGVHHQNDIIGNKNRVLTKGAQKLLLHGIRMWPQMIDDMFWPFSMKCLAKRLNSLQVDILGMTPEYILHGVEVQYIPVKSYHTPFCTTYVLIARL